MRADLVQLGIRFLLAGALSSPFADAGVREQVRKGAIRTILNIRKLSSPPFSAGLVGRLHSGAPTRFPNVSRKLLLLSYSPFFWGTMFSSIPRLPAQYGH